MNVPVDDYNLRAVLPNACFNEQRNVYDTDFVACKPVTRDFPYHFLPHSRVDDSVQQLPLSLVTEYDLTQSSSVNSARSIFQNNVVPKRRDNLGVGRSAWLDDTSRKNVRIHYGDSM